MPDSDPCTTDTCTATGCTHDPMHGTMTFEATGTIVQYAVACTADLKVEAWGAAGGDALTNKGGAGAYATGTIAGVRGTMLSILVGGHGLASTDLMEQSGGSGGGGTFVVAMTNPIVIAGGGGGAWNHNENGSAIAAHDGLPGRASNDGDAGGGAVGGTGGVAGTAGNGGGTGSWPGWHNATGAGGFLTSGLNPSNGASSYGTPNLPGSGFMQGGAGGVPGSGDTTHARAGGFGGGGCAGMTGGGGGGYSGGGGGGYYINVLGGFGGGGGSFVSASATQVTITAGANLIVDGRVTLTW